MVSIDLPSGDQLHALLHLPPRLVDDEGRRAAAPLILHFPSALGQQVQHTQFEFGLGLILSLQVVTSRWSLGLPTYLASSLEIAVLEVKTLHCSKVLNLVVKINVN